MWAKQKLINIGGYYLYSVIATSAARCNLVKLSVADAHADAEVGVENVVLGKTAWTVNIRNADGRSRRKRGVNPGTSGGECNARKRPLVSVLSAAVIAALLG